MISGSPPSAARSVSVKGCTAAEITRAIDKDRPQTEVWCNVNELCQACAACIATIEYHLEDAPRLLPLVFGKREGAVELLEDQLHHALKLALLLRGQMIKIGAHDQMSVAGADSRCTFVLTLFVRRRVCRAAATGAMPAHVPRPATWQQWRGTRPAAQAGHHR